MEWIHSSEQECSWLWVKTPGLNSVFCGPGLQCLSKYKKQQKVLSATLCLVSQKQNGNYKITKKYSKLMLIMFLVTSEKYPNKKKHSSSLSETRVLWKLQCEVKHSSFKSQSMEDCSWGGSASMDAVGLCSHQLDEFPCSQLCGCPSWDGHPGIHQQRLIRPAKHSLGLTGLRADLSTALSHTHC